MLQIDDHFLERSFCFGITEPSYSTRRFGNWKSSEYNGFSKEKTIYLMHLCSDAMQFSSHGRIFCSEIPFLECFRTLAEFIKSV